MNLAQARLALASALPRIDEYIVTRATLFELRADLAARGNSPHGGMAEAKALEARLFADTEHFHELGAVVKGYGPLLLDFPGIRDGEHVLWCWLEGETDITWYHRVDTGFAGRRVI